MDKKFKPQIPAVSFVGTVFAPIGLIFTIIGLVSAHAIRSGTMQIDGDSTVFKWVFFGVGALFLVLGLCFLGAAFVSVRAQKRVFEQGKCVYAAFERAEENLNVTINGRHPFRAVLLYTDEFGVQHEFRSRDVLHDTLAQLTGKPIPVYIDNDDPEQYYVDLESILESR